MNTKALMQQDTLSRQKIVENIHSNFFVEAGAGSGKTTILVKRMVAMVEQGIDVSKICAITFTKAAAGEFYARFQKALIERSTAETKSDFVPTPGELGNPTDITRSRCLQALNDIDLCFMGTIDSFCNIILSEHPAKAGIPSNAAVLSYDDMLSQYKKAYSDIQKGYYGKDLQQLCRRFCALHDRPNEVFIGAIGKLMDTRNCEFVFDRASNSNVDIALKDAKAVFLPIFETLLAHPELKYDNNGPSREAWDTLQAKAKMLLAPWQDNANQIMRALGTIGNLRLIPETDLAIFGAAGATVFQSHLSRNKISWYEFSEDGLQVLAKQLQDLQYSVSMEFLTAATETIAQNLQAEGKLTFFDYLLYLRDTLKADAMADGALIQHIYDRHQYFLIDEFQDTNPMQAEVFFYLTAQNPQEDWRKCIPHPGSLFIVGDPKQSIYRFRYADVSAFLRIKEMFKGNVGEVVYLTRNFRSTHRIRSWFNSTFQALLPEATPLQSQFEPIPLEEAPASDGTFEGIYSYETFSGKNAAPQDMDPAKVAKIIHRIVGNPAYQIRQRGDQESRLVTYQDIMLITPRKTKMGDYICSFTEQGIPFRIEGKVLFSQCPALVAASRIFAAVASPNSLQVLIGALTCKRFGFNLNALHRLKNGGYDFSLYAEHTDSEPISEALEKLKQLVWRSHRLSAASLFSVILEELEIFKYAGAKDLEYTYYALELLRSAESAGQFSTLPQAAAYLEMLISDSSDAERAISLTRNENRVHIANLHKVKGLEAPIVILADPHSKSNPPDVRVEQQDPKPLCWIFSVRKGFGNLLSCSGYEDAKDAEVACLEAEKKRLLYVAATRAQRVLIVADAITSKGESDEKNPWKFFVDRCDGDFFQELPVGEIAAVTKKPEVSATELYDGATNLLETTTSGEKSFSILRPSQIKLKGKTSSEDDFEDVQEAEIRTHTVRANAAVIGTLVHSLMEAMVSSGNTAPLSALVREIVSEYEAESENYNQLLTKVGNTIQNGGFPQENEAPQDILRVLLHADEVYCEVPFCRKNGNEIWHGIMDVVYCIGEQWFILDYKTNADAHDLDTKYQEQLAAYVEAFRDLTGHTATPLIYHIDV